MELECLKGPWDTHDDWHGEWAYHEYTKSTYEANDAGLIQLYLNCMAL